MSAAASCTVLIAAADLLPALRERTQTAGEVLEFSDAEALRALDVIITRRPSIVAVERLFAASPRGAALINRIKADPGLSGLEVHVVSHESDSVQVPSRRAPGEAGAAHHGAATAATVARSVQPLDPRGTRRAPRFRIGGSVGALVDGNAATLVDLSTIGAQVVSSSILKPNQRVRMALSDDHGTVRFNAAVAWASFEISSRTGPHYRAGIEFVNADSDALDGFCHRHKA